MRVNTIMCRNAVCLTQINVHAHLMLQNFIHFLYNSINNFASYLPKLYTLHAQKLTRDSTVISHLRCCMCVMDSPALQMQRAISRPTVKLVMPVATWQHHLHVDSNFLQYSGSQNFAQNAISSSVGRSNYLPQLSSNSVQQPIRQKRRNASVGTHFYIPYHVLLHA